VGVFVAVPLLALIAAVPLAWGWGLGWHDVALAIAFYYISGLSEWPVQGLYGRYRDLLAVYGKEEVYGSIP
jgi:hypothetical protein